MLRGAHKAVERVGARSLERVWIVAVPVIFALTLDWLARLLLMYHLTTAHFPGGATAPLLAAGGPMVLRTAILLVCLGATGYAAVWTWPSLREILRLGRRAFPGPALSRAVAGLVLLLVAGLTTVSAAALPGSGAFLSEARADLDRGSFVMLRTAIVCDVIGVRDLCREMRDGADPDRRFYGAAGLYHLGDRSPQTRHAIHEWFEANRDRLSSREFRRQNFWAIDLVRGSPFYLPPEELLTWWDGVRESFRKP